jgi:Ca2+-binding EF-hand superfamily protein
LASFGEEVSDEEIVNRMRMWDGDGDGKINFPEFLIAMAQILTDTENEERMREAFRIFDKVMKVCKVCNCTFERSFDFSKIRAKRAN